MKHKNLYRCYDRIEIQFEPEENIDIIKVTRPDGVIDSVEPFIYQPIQIEYDETGIEHIKEMGRQYLCCRYTPEIEGQYFLGFYCNGKLVEERKIQVRDVNGNGFVEVSKKDKSYFVYSNGEPYFQIGINTAFPTCYPISNGIEFGKENAFCYVGLRQYERWIKKCSENGANVVRIWFGYPYFSPDTKNTYQFEWSQF